MEGGNDGKRLYTKQVGKKKGEEVGGTAFSDTAAPSSGSVSDFSRLLDDSMNPKGWLLEQFSAKAPAGKKKELVVVGAAYMIKDTGAFQKQLDALQKAGITVKILAVQGPDETESSYKEKLNELKSMLATDEAKKTGVTLETVAVDFSTAESGKTSVAAYTKALTGLLQGVSSPGRRRAIVMTSRDEKGSKRFDEVVNASKPDRDTDSTDKGILKEVMPVLELSSEQKRKILEMAEDSSMYRVLLNEQVLPAERAKELSQKLTTIDDPKERDRIYKKTVESYGLDRKIGQKKEGKDLSFAAFTKLVDEYLTGEVKKVTLDVARKALSANTEMTDEESDKLRDNKVMLERNPALFLETLKKMNNKYPKAISAGLAEAVEKAYKVRGFEAPGDEAAKPGTDKAMTDTNAATASLDALEVPSRIPSDAGTVKTR